MSKRNPGHGKLIYYSLLAFFIAVSCSVSAQLPTQTPIVPTDTLPPTPTQTPVPTATPGNQIPDWLTIYFTNPFPPDQTGSGIDQIVNAAIASAEKTVDVTSFDLNLPSFVEALVNAQGRGVTVRVVYDGENGTQQLAASLSPTGKKYDAIKTLDQAGIQTVDDGRSSGLMHDKMIIIDGKILFMGSWNMSYNDTFRNNNNLLEITDPTLIANYQAKFDELFVDRRYGRKAEVGAQTPEMTLEGVKVSNYFSPVDHVMDKLVALVNGARKSVHFMIYTFTDKDLANAMIDQYKAGLDVSGVIEDRDSTKGALVPLACAQVPVKVDGNKYTMHHKVLIIDDAIVVTGSFNFTVSADQDNDDNAIVIYNGAVALRYLEEFDRVQSIAQDPDPADIKCTP